MRAQVLVVDDDPSMLASLSRVLERMGHKVLVADTGRGGLAMVDREPIDLVLLDVHLPDQDGLSILSAIRANGHEVPVLMMSGEGTVELAVRAVQLGALDFLEKPIGPDRARISIENALKYQALASSHAELERVHGEWELIGEAPPMTELRDLIERAAPTEGRVLILGENGTGKELVARAIHQKSRRAKGPFIHMNCAAVPSELIDSELFGHERGAFTGAQKARRGRFELADQGTLLLDEVGEMSAAMQAKVLRVLQEGVFERVGGSETISVDVRVIAATNRDLSEMVEMGQFREDLFYRLNVITVHTPALRDRASDIAVLAQHFLRRIAERNNRPQKPIEPAALDRLRTHDYPGNVRELQNLVERLLILSPGDRITAEDVGRVLPSGRRKSKKDGVSLYRPGETFRDMVDEAQRIILRAALEAHQNNMTETASALGLERSHLYKKCRQLAVDRPD